jgi:hypothetical protein
MKCAACSTDTNGKYGKHSVCIDCYFSDRLFDWLRIHDPSEYQACLKVRLAAVDQNKPH